MNANEIRDLLRSQPFEPLRLHLSDGASYDVPHPEMVLVTRYKIHLALPPSEGEMPERTVYLDPLHITRVEPIRTPKSA